MNLPELWKRSPIKTVVKLLGGGTPIRTNARFFGGEIPWVTPVDITTETNLYLQKTKETVTEQGIRVASLPILEPGTVLMTARASVGAVAIASEKTTTSQDLINFVPNANILNSEYLAYLIRRSSKEILRFSTGTTFSAVSQAGISKWQIPVPPLLEQERIVTILEQAEKIRNIKTKIQEDFQKVLKSIFLQTFGYPQENKTWQQIPLSELGELERGMSKHRPRDAALLYGGKYPFIQTGDIASSNGWIETYTNTYSEAGLKQSRLWGAGTLCISIAANIAKTAILTFDACFPDSVVGFIAGDKVTVEYIKLYIDYLRDTLESRAAVSSQKNINLGTLNEILIPIPPKEIQLEFSKKVHFVYSMIQKMNSSDAVFAGALSNINQSAFAGTLTQKWREQPDIAPQLEQQAKARDALLAGQQETTPETEVVLEVPSLTTLEARKDFAKRFQDLLKNDQKVQLQTVQDVIPVQYFDAFMDSNLDPDMYSFQSNIIQTFQNSDNTELQNVASELENILNTRAEYNPNSPTHPRKHFWYEIKDKDSPLRLVYNAIRIGREYNNANTISQVLTELGHNLEKHKIVQALDTLESAGLIDAVLLEIPINQSLLSEVVQVMAYRLPSPSISVTVQVPNVGITFAAGTAQVKITQ